VTLTRRDLVRGLACASGLGLSLRPRVAAAAAGASDEADMAALKRAFAPPATAPDSLLAFARWSRSEAAAGLPFAEGLWGDHGSWTDRFNEYWIEEGSDLAERFAQIVPIGDGSQIALWNRSGGPAAQWPVVLIGGEGEAAVLADSWNGFLARVALAQFSEPAGVDTGTDDYSWLEFQTSIENDGGDAAHSNKGERAELAAAREARKALGEWLRKTTGQPDLVALARRATPYHALREFFDAHRKSVIARRGASHDWLALRELMRPYGNAGKLATSRDIDIVCADDYFVIGELDGRTFVPFKDAAKAEPLIRALREERTQRFAAHGLWHSATVRVYPDALQEDRIDLIANYLDPLYERRAVPRPAAAAVRADFERCPRTSWWTPGWLKAIVTA